MNGTAKGIIAGSVILAVSFIICTVMITAGIRQAQTNAFAFIETHKQAVANYVAFQKEDLRRILSAQKQELKRIAAAREGKIKNLIKEELENATIEVKNNNP
ncbi:MAG: hypothetical protein ABH843_05445 [Candidatus Omnitrophota bacterium]